MIGKLTGKLDFIADNYVIIDVNGVGYIVFCSTSAISLLGSEGDVVSLLIETHVREDHIHLYGFISAEEKEWFLILTKVSGVGAKMGLAILSAMQPQQISVALASGDKAAFTAISGVGPKLAARLLTELKGKEPEISIGVVASNGSGNSSPSNSGAMDGAVSALSNLGYDKSAAYKVVATIVTNDPEAAMEDLIRQALQELGGN